MSAIFLFAIFVLLPGSWTAEALDECKDVSVQSAADLCGFVRDTINCYVNKKVSDNIVDSMRFFWRDLWETHFSKLCLDFENIHALYELVDDSGDVLPVCALNIHRRCSDKFQASADSTDQPDYIKWAECYRLVEQADGIKCNAPIIDRFVDSFHKLNDRKVADGSS